MERRRNKTIVRNLTSEEWNLVKDYRNGFRFISWHVDDFEQRAQENEDFGLGPYDRTKFKDAFERMMKNHDANCGISWDTIDAYLNDYCYGAKEEL